MAESASRETALLVVCDCPTCTLFDFDDAEVKLQEAFENMQDDKCASPMCYKKDFKCNELCATCNYIHADWVMARTIHVFGSVAGREFQHMSVVDWCTKWNKNLHGRTRRGSNLCDVEVDLLEEDDEEDDDCLDHSHYGLEIGTKVAHKHHCTECDEVFSHTHTIKTYEESIQFPQKCENCEKQVEIKVEDVLVDSACY